MKAIIITLLLLQAIFLRLPRASRDESPVPGACRTDQYLEMLRGKSVAVVANQTSMVGKTHLVDTLLSLGTGIKEIFSPEHGFREML